MFKWLRRLWVFRRAPEFRPNMAEADPNRDAVIRKCFETGKAVVGTYDDDDNFSMEVLGEDEEKMTPHEWEIEELDSGHLGTNDFWICRRCGASGGSPHYERRPDGTYGLFARGQHPESRDSFGFRWDTGLPFYADGSGLKLADDCDESRELVYGHFRERMQRVAAEGFNRELAAQFEVAASTVNRWADGIARPHPRLVKSILDAARKIFYDQLPDKAGDGDR